MIGRTALRLLFLLFSMGAFGTAVFCAWQPDAAVHEILASPVILELAAQYAKTTPGIQTKQTEPLMVKQAKLFSLHLNPPPPPKKPVQRSRSNPGHTAQTKKPDQPKAGSVPNAITPKFQVVATSVYEAKPSKSLALIAEPGTALRWVKPGEMVGHVLIEDIQKSKVVWRNGESSGQLAVVTITPTPVKPGPSERITGGHRLAGNQKPSSTTKVKSTVPRPVIRSKPKPISRGLRSRR